MSDDKEEQNAAAGDKQAEQQFTLQKIYLKDISFETPNSPEIFTEEWKPDVNVELQTAGKPLTDEVMEVVLTVTVTAKLGDKTAYLAEAHQAGVFTIAGFSDDERVHMQGSYCPNILFPYAREAISDLVSKGGFPQLLLAPVNFDALLAQHKQQAEASAKEIVH
ncbi:MAG TPA: protein-export chaperone SecB [Gammaproteobacteria bacterium]|nr:protein-export chaperone SecB [Gammaproteobacteria bacterium]